MNKINKILLCIVAILFLYASTISVLYFVGDTKESTKDGQTISSTDTSTDKNQQKDIIGISDSETVAFGFTNEIIENMPNYSTMDIETELGIFAIRHSYYNGKTFNDEYSIFNYDEDIVVQSVENGNNSFNISHVSHSAIKEIKDKETINKDIVIKDVNALKNKFNNSNVRYSLLNMDSLETTIIDEINEETISKMFDSHFLIVDFLDENNNISFTSFFNTLDGHYNIVTTFTYTKDVPFL